MLQLSSASRIIWWPLLLPHIVSPEFFPLEEAVKMASSQLVLLDVLSDEVPALTSSPVEIGPAISKSKFYEIETLWAFEDILFMRLSLFGI